MVDENNVTYELELTATDHGQPARSTSIPVRLMFVVSRLIPPPSEGMEAGRRRGGARGGTALVEGWVPLAVAAACGVGLVLLCTVLAVLACVTRRRRRRGRRYCSKRHQNVDAAAALPLTGGKYNCRVESLKAVSVCSDNSNG